MSCRLVALSVCLVVSNVAFSQDASKERAAAIERGMRAARGQPPMNPSLWSVRSYENAWKAWSKEAPADLNRAIAERYGLVEAPYDNNKLPMGLHLTTGPFGKGIVNDCMMCHSGRVAGKTIIGVGNNAVDVQGIYEELIRPETPFFDVPFKFSYVRGTIDPISPVTFLLSLRDADLNIGKRHELDGAPNTSSDPPAWWLLKKKKTRDWTGIVDARSTRVDMVNLLSPFNSGDHIKKHASTFADIHAFLLSVEAPKYPFPIDAKLAEQGRGLFTENCARCHGNYGEKPSYPSKVVPLKTLGTDPLLSGAMTKKTMDFLNSTWLAQEKVDGERLMLVDRGAGYQAPPLDGVWATAPYFHNASVPTLFHVLNSKARPKYFTRSYRGEVEDYDQENVGVKITLLKGPADPKLPPIERRKIYDTARPGLSNAGHDFGDHFTDAERRAVIEYLKTL
ncbi:MAG: c-type cytochrome [Gemmataceae bacterium]